MYDYWEGRKNKTKNKEKKSVPLNEQNLES